MTTIQRHAVRAIAVAALLGAAGCAGMSTQDRNTAIGAGIGAVGGLIVDQKKKGNIDW